MAHQCWKSLLQCVISTISFQKPLNFENFAYQTQTILIVLKILFIYFREREREGEGEGEKHQCVFASHLTPAGDLACNLGMCPDWKSNWTPFGLQVGTQTTEKHQPGQAFLILYSNILLNFWIEGNRKSLVLRFTIISSLAELMLKEKPWIFKVFFLIFEKEYQH